MTVCSLEKAICCESQEDDQEDKDAGELEDVFLERHDSELYSLIYNSWSEQHKSLAVTFCKTILYLDRMINSKSKKYWCF